MDVPEEVRAVLGTDPRVQAAYLFGSRVRGEAHPTSDVDLGVLLPADLPRLVGGPLDELRLALELRLGLEVDLVDLRAAPADLVHRVLRDGDLLVNADPRARVAFEVRRRAEYLDLKPYLEHYRRVATS